MTKLKICQKGKKKIPSIRLDVVEYKDVIY